jgi:hypothetical protein
VDPLDLLRDVKLTTKSECESCFRKLSMVAIQRRNAHTPMAAASKARTDFIQSIKDAEELLAHYNRAAKGKSPLPPNTEVLKRAGLILAITAWETYVEDRVGEALNEKLRTLSDASISAIITKKFEEDLKRFNNPDAPKTRKLFQDYVGIDPTATWKCSAAPAETSERLSKWVRRRCDAAHRSKRVHGTPTPHLVGRTDLVSLIAFLKTLVDETEKAICEAPSSIPAPSAAAPL